MDLVSIEENNLKESNNSTQSSTSVRSYESDGELPIERTEDEKIQIVLKKLKYGTGFRAIFYVLRMDEVTLDKEIQQKFFSKFKYISYDNPNLINNFIITGADGTDAPRYPYEGYCIKHVLVPREAFYNNKRNLGKIIQTVVYPPTKETDLLMFELLKFYFYGKGSCGLRLCRIRHLRPGMDSPECSTEEDICEEDEYMEEVLSVFEK